MKVILTSDEATRLLYGVMVKEIGESNVDVVDIEIETEPVPTLDKERLARFVQDRVLRDDHKIPIIKDLRTLTNWGLREAKDFYENNATPF